MSLDTKKADDRTLAKLEKLLRENQTTAPIEASPPSAVDPEFVDVPGLFSRFGIKRSLAYVLLKDGVIKGVSLRRRGHTRGKRLFAVDSVRAFLRSQMEAERQ
jgi:hypothetical protein